MNRWVLQKSVFFIVLTGLFMGSCGLPAWAREPRPLTISGATTLQPVAEKLAVLYTRDTGIAVSVTGGGSGAGLRHVASGTSDLGMVSRELRGDEKKSVNHLTVARDALVFIVNDRNPLKHIDLKTVVDLFSGRLTHWRKATDWDEPVVLVSKEMGRATLDLFEGYTGLHHPGSRPGPRGNISGETIEVGANVEVLMLVGGLPGAIGYVSLGAAGEMMEQGMPIRILELDGVAAEMGNVLSGRYPIGRELNFVFKERDSVNGAFLDLALSPAGREIIESEGFIPVGRR